MAASDLKTMTKQSLEKNRIFFDEAISKIEDLRFYASRFGGSCDDLLLKQIDLDVYKRQVSGPDSGEYRLEGTLTEPQLNPA